VNKKTKHPARYGSGMLWLRGRIWHVKWREVRRQPDGQTDYIQHSQSTGSEDKRFAQRFLNRRLQETGGRRPTVVDPQKVTYDDLKENFLAHCVDKGLRSLKYKNGQPTLNTIPRLDKFFGSYRANEITTLMLRRFRAEGRREGLSDARLNRYMATIRAMLRQGVKDELIDNTPAYFPVTTEKNVARGAIYIKPEWYKPLRQALKEPLRSAFTLAYHVGIRVHEMMRLHWRDVNMKERIVILPAEITKTGDTRPVPLPSDFDLKPSSPDQLVFPLGDCRERWRTACVKAGAGHYECRQCGTRCQGRECPTHGKLAAKKARYVGITLRHTRHTAVRNMVDSGMEKARAKAISGHITDSTFDRYNIGKEEDLEYARRSIEQYHRAEQKRI
jgi:integrase